MSIISTVANYGGKVGESQQGIKQFFVSPSSMVTWIFQRKGTTLVQTPANATVPVFINNDLIVAGSMYNTSDRRLKDGVQPITQEDVDHFSTLNPVHYMYKNDASQRHHFGVVAQDVEEWFPDMVEDSHLGYKTVNYQEFIPLIMAKMKQMQKEIDELRHRTISKE